MADPLDQLQNPQAPASQPSENLAVINQFNQADSNKRNIANGFASGQLPEYDDKIMRLHGIDARVLSGEMAPLDQLDPKVLQQSQLLQSQGMLSPAYDMMAEENRKHIARSQYGSAMSPEEWDSLRDYAGRKAAIHAHAPAPGVMDTGPASKEAFYQSGVEAFDNAFGKHKKYLVEYPHQKLKAPSSQPSHPPLAPHELAILQLMKNAGTIAQQQQQGMAPVAPDDFAAAIGVGK